MRVILSCLFFLLMPLSLWAEPVRYSIDRGSSDIGFYYQFGEQKIKGKFKDYDIDLTIDFQRVAKSNVAVSLDTTTATAGLVFATEALRSKQILWAKEHPAIRFQSFEVSGGGNTALINGEVTIRGITQPLLLTAELFRAADSSADERDNLTIKITGELDRFEFGADGYAAEVGPILRIDIDAAIVAIR